MDFKNLHVKEIVGVVHYSPKTQKWTSKNRVEHIVGIQLKGKALHTFANYEFTISENCVYFLNKKDNYDVSLIEQTDAFSIHFTTYEEIETDSFCFTVSNPHSFISILQKAETSKVSGSELALRSMLYLFCSDMERAREKSYYRKDERIIEAKRYIDEHFREKNCIEEAISISGVSGRHFRSLFHSAYDTTAAGYILSLKIELAKNLLSVGTLPISEIAELCGFFDIYHFSKAFKNEVGIPPSKWKSGF